MALELKLVEPLIVEGAEFRRQATEGPVKPELRGDDVNHETEPGLLRKLEAVLGFTLYLNERIPRREKVRVQVVAAKSRKGQVTDLVRGIEGATHQIAASTDMFRPWHDNISERHIRTGLVARQSALFNQLTAEPAEPEPGLIVAEARSSYDAKPYIAK